MTRLASREPVVVRLALPVSPNDLLWVANTWHGPGAHWHARPRAGAPDHDHLVDPDDARRYLGDHGVPVPGGPPDETALAGLRIVREAIREGFAGHEPWTDASLGLLASASYRVAPDGRLLPVRRGWPGLVAGLVAGLATLDTASLGECGNPVCRLMFLDSSRNRRRTWCDSAGCGNRFRVRDARVRAAGPAAGESASDGPPATPAPA
jgi:hypothetical protein